MAIYAIGDIQGCFSALEKLLLAIRFDERRDVLWSTGDLVNRGPQSLEVLRFFYALGDRHRVVLGNHDLHLLAVAEGMRALHHEDTVSDILAAPDRDELLLWLRRRPLLWHDEASQYVITHAGLAPMWTLKQAMLLAQEVEQVLRGKDYALLLKNMYGNEPDLWRNDLSGLPRYRCIINYFTRMRLCDAQGRLELNYKGKIADKPDALTPWFEVGSRINANEKIIFGHWAALGGVSRVKNIFPLDTGCVWGGCLTAMRLEDGERFQVTC